MKTQILMDLSIYWAMFHVTFLFIMLFRSRYPKKKTLWLVGSIMGLIMLINVVVLAVFGLEVTGRLFLFTCSLPSFLFMYLLSADKKFRFLLTFCLADTLCIWIMAVTNLLDHYLGGGQYVVMFISRLVAFPLIEYWIYRFLRKPYLELQNAVEKGWGVFAGMTMLYYVLLIVIVQYPTNIVNRPEDVFLCVLVLVLMFFNYATIFYALYNQFLVYRKQQSERILQEQKYSLETKLENQQRIRRMKHDMKGHTVTLSGLLAAGKTEEAKEYLKNLEIEMEALTGQFCLSPYINAVLSHYFQKLQEMGAEFYSDIRIGEEALPYMELCQILSNGLENACDELKDLTEGKREAFVRVKYHKDYLTIRIRNRCRPNLHVEKGELPDTSKEGGDHGFGLRTIQEAAERLGGDMLCYTEDGYFVLDVMVRVSSEPIIS